MLTFKLVQAVLFLTFILITIFWIYCMYINVFVHVSICVYAFYDRNICIHILCISV